MERKLFVLCFLLLIFCLSGECIEINFKMKAEVTTLDSIKVENLTRNENVILSQSNILSLMGTALEKDIYHNNSIRIIPNPIMNVGEVSFFVPVSGLASINICDIAGRALYTTKQNLLTGYKCYIISGLTNELNLISIQGIGYSYKAILMYRGQEFGKVELKPKYESIDVRQKIKNSSIALKYECGDEIRYIGFHGIARDTVTDVPNTDQTVVFEFEKYLPSSSFLTDKESYTIGDNVIFSSVASNIISDWKWDFGDGNNDDQQNCNHIYNLPGTYVVSLTTTNEFGSTIFTKQITVKGKGLLFGNIILKSGNCMPCVSSGPMDCMDTSCHTDPVATKITITKPTDIYSTDLEIVSTYSRTDGYYSISLPEGEYTLFIINTTGIIWELWHETKINFIMKENENKELNVEINNFSW